MKRTLILLTACTAPGPVQPEAWQLDQDRVLAVRVTPPGIAADEHAIVDGLIAHADGPPTVELPSVISAPDSPLYTAVNFLVDHYEIIGPDVPPQPLELKVYFGPLSGDHFNTQKVMDLGVSEANDAIDIALPATIAVGTDVTLSAAGDVRWYTSCGGLRDATEPTAILRADEPCTGQLVVVVRDDRAGIAWQVGALVAQ